MTSQFIVYSFVVTITIGSLLSSVQSKYNIGNFDDWIAKRSYQRRSFLQSFCARRCNIGQGGNVCKCNGFHFAGKRSGVDESNTLHSEEEAAGADTPVTTDVIYKMLEDNDRLIIDDDQFEKGDGRPAQRTFKPTIDAMYPTYRKQSNKNNRFDPVLDLLLRTYMYNEDD